MTSRKVYTCCNQLPHDRFLGVEHYLRMNCNQLILSSPKHSLKKDKTIESSKSIDDDDDDDVIISNREQ
ncbi:unnamed protein product [Rotaria sp. Silwood2]|nr:unnamed protein product [Rotaria sp. Silwood2]CAF2792961.1 unnamed protein product [Rotaria sp. Silwood2]CAF3035608.1 unnamed protein product [Rotaria sp. Silwood2]CAF3234026.1 unnamed protein product [Rotaria sp. Silwood2]CAF4060147.1 unnamed protein product [Rotaria sp. Silwood2]